jgi:hypothetical protein
MITGNIRLTIRYIFIIDLFGGTNTNTTIFYRHIKFRIARLIEKLDLHFFWDSRSIIWLDF